MAEDGPAHGDDDAIVPDENAPATFPAVDVALPTEADAGATRALAGLLTLSPFLDLHQRASGHHPVRGHLCFALDLALRLVATGLLLGIIGGVAWKVLAPLPQLFEP